MRKIGLLFAAAAAARAQSVSVGVKGGSPLNDPSTFFFPYATSTQDRWTGGATAEIHLPFRFSIEADALYRGERGGGSFPLNLGLNTASYLANSSQKTKSWDFPILLKYRLLNGPVRPYVSAGYAWSHQNTKGFSSYNCLGGQGACTPPDTNFVLRGSAYDSSSVRRGPAAGAGIEFRTHRVTISPEVRYMHLMHPNTNQVSVLVGLTFSPKVFSVGKRGWRSGAAR
jgi:opacity protein-like surface antigen